MKIYLDMDGVIADFLGALEKRFNVDHWKDLEDPQLTIRGLKNTDWFFHLDEFKSSTKLVNAVRELAGQNYGICSSPIQRDDYNSAYWKRRWLEEHDFMPKVSNFVITSNKWKFAHEEISGEPNILVDDKPDNIHRWEAAGGNGILYQANKDDVEDLIGDLEWAYNSMARFGQYS